MLAQDPDAEAVVASNEALCVACEAAPQDNGASLYMLIQEWTDPREDMLVQAGSASLYMLIQERMDPRATDPCEDA